MKGETGPAMNDRDDRPREECERDPVANRKAWAEENDRLNAEILERLGAPLDMETMLREARTDLERRDDERLGPSTPIL
jgi:hypothetical protein